MATISDERIRRILTLPGETTAEWEADLAKLESGDTTLTRRSIGESSIKAVQRMLIFLGYSTSSTGAFVVDGDFGRGTNRAVAQFQYEHKLTRSITRKVLCYDCTWQTAAANIVAIPDARLNMDTLERMVSAALGAIKRRQVLCGDFDEALYHLDALHRRQLLSCREILARYGSLIAPACTQVQSETGISVEPAWVLAVIRQETSGIVRPRFEQHLLTRLNGREPRARFVPLRMRSMSFGLGQILGANYQVVGAASPAAMYASPLVEQVLFVARFIARKAGGAVSKGEPAEADFREFAKTYNGPGYEKHHYHESIARWFREFRALAA